MEDINALLDMSPSRSDSLQYASFPESGEQFIDNYSSASQSPMDSPYDMPYLAELKGVPSFYPSPERDPSEDASQATEASVKEAKPAAKRKRENRYKNAPPSVLSRRRAQNRASQRAYRERKDQRIKDLEQMLNEAKQRNDVLSQAFSDLQAECVRLKTSQLQETAAAAAAASSYPRSEISFEGHPGLDFDGRLDAGMYVFPDMSSAAPHPPTVSAGYGI